MARALSILALLLCGCTATIEIEEEALEAPWQGEAQQWDRVAMSFSVALQRGDWGATITRCQVEVAFTDPGSHDGLWEGTGNAVIELPKAPGTCAYTSFGEDEQSLGLWQVRGSWQGGEALWLHGPDDSLELVRQTDEDGRVYYGLEACDDDIFPFSEVLDIEVPGDDGDDGLGAFFAEEAFVVGPDIVLTELPADLDESARLVLDPPRDHVLAWDYRQDMPVARGAAVQHVPYLMLRNMHQGEEQPFEALACQPDVWGQITVPAADLAQLEPMQDDATGDPYLAMQLDAWYEGPKVRTPWGSSTRVLSAVTEGGIALLPP